MTSEEKPEDGSEWSRMSREERLKALEEVSPKAFEVLTENNPNWQEAFLYRLILAALTNLRYYLEEATDDAISWESPFVEVQIPAEPEAPPMSDLPDEVLSSPEEATKAAGLRLDAVLLREIIRGLTGNAVTLRKDGVEFSWIPADLQKEMDSWPKKKRERFLETYGDPFVLGATYFEEGRDFEEGPEDEPQKLTRKGRRRIGGVSPLFPFSGMHDETPFSGSFAVAFHPLVLDEDARDAYFPVVVGIQFSPLEAGQGEESRFPNPAEWTKDDREQFWTAVLTPIIEAERSLRGKGGTGGTAAAPESTQSQETEPPPQETVTTSTTAETPETHTVDTMEVLQSTALVPAAPGRVGPPSETRRPRFLLNAETRHSRHVAHIVRTHGNLTFPKKWSAIPKWTDLEEREKAFWLDTLGEDAFRETAERPAFLKRVTFQGRDPKTGKRKDREEVILTNEAEQALEDREGIRGFIRTEPDPGKRLREWFVKTVRTGNARVTTRVSWYSEALFLAGDGQDIRRRELLAVKERWKQGDLFEELSPRQKAVVEGLLENLEMIRYGKVFMEELSARFGAEGRNPLRVPAHDLKVLLGCENDPHAMERIRGGLFALTEFRFGCEIEGSARPVEMYGSFLASYRYEGRGPGDHSDGDFVVWINPDFLGALTVFRVWTSKDKDARELYEWTRTLNEGEKEKLRNEPFCRGFSTLSTYFHAAKGFTETQKSLCRWIENQITRNADPVPNHRKRLRARKSAPDAQKPRLYGHEFCPLIPEGKLLAGALGSFKNNPEAGRTLGGTARRPTKTGGGHAEGLLSAMGYDFPPGAAWQRREKILRNALQDIRYVVQDSFQGVVAARTLDGKWMTLEEAAESIPEEDLVKVRWLLFVTPDLTEHIGREVQKHQDKRFEKGETPYPIKVTTDRRLLEASRERETAETIKKLEEASKAGTAKVGLEWSPLWQQLRAATKRKGLTQTKAAGLFGVSQPTFAGWIAGPERGYSIPEELVPLVKRWVDGGEPPTPEELASRKTKRPGVNPETGKPWTRPRKGTEAPPDDAE